MFFLRARTYQRTLIILHCRGYRNADGFGFVDGEGIFEVEETMNPLIQDSVLMQVVRQVGHVEVQGNKLVFNYTDADFRSLIKFNETTGYSTMDGGQWTVHNINYVDIEGNTEREMKRPKLGICMYTSAQNPFTHIGNPASFFSNSMKQPNTPEITLVTQPFPDDNWPTELQASILRGFTDFNP